MKVFRKGLGLILGGLIAISVVGCSNRQIEQGEELLNENIINEIEENIEKYEPLYNELDSKEKESVDWAKRIDMDKIDVDIKELDDVYEVIVTLNYKKDGYSEYYQDIFYSHIEKDKLTKDDLMNREFLYQVDLMKEVVAHKTTFERKDGITTWLHCVKGYEGYTEDEKNTKYDKYCSVAIYSKIELENKFYTYLGNIIFSE